MSEDYAALAAYLESLQDRLDEYKRRQRAFRALWLALFCCLLLIIGVTFWVGELWIPLMIMILFAGLMVYTLRLNRISEQTIRQLEHEVSRLPYRMLAGNFEKPKNDDFDEDTEYVIGADGELIPYDEAEKRKRED